MNYLKRLVGLQDAFNLIGLNTKPLHKPKRKIHESIVIGRTGCR